MVESKHEQKTHTTDMESCRQCGSPNPVGKRFCGECGTQLLADASSSEGPAGRRGPRIQVTFVYGEFGGDGALDAAAIETLHKRMMGRVRLVITESGGHFEDLGEGRFAATFGMQFPTEEDPITAVTVSLKVLRLVSLSKKTPPIRLVACTGRISNDAKNTDLIRVGEDGELEGHELLDKALRYVEEAEAGTLRVDGLTHRMIRDTFRCVRVENLEGTFFGRGLYDVQGTHTTTELSVEPELVGRTRELGRMVRAFERVERGEGPIFFSLTGELGTGKSRLVRELINVAKGRATLFKNPRQRRRVDRWRRTPYSYFGDILRSFFDIQENDEGDVCRQKLLEGVEAALIGTFPEESIHLMGLLCQVDFPGSPHIAAVDDDPAQLEKLAFTAFSEFLMLCAQSKPMLFVLDSLYAADSSSLRLLQFLTEELEDTQCLFICTTRTSFFLELERDAGLQLPGERLVLKPLDHESAQKMAEELLPSGSQLPRKLLKRILTIAEGNPYFLRESIRELVERDFSEVLVHGDDVENLEIPGSIEGILLSRLSRLDTFAREVLQKASVFGKTFWRGGVEMLYRKEGDFRPGWKMQDGVFLNRKDDLEEVLDQLVQLGVIQYQNQSVLEGEAQYLFVPSLMQELVYQEIPMETRISYHRSAGQWLEVTARERRVELFMELAHHFSTSQDFERAAAYHLKVGKSASKISATNKAVEHLELALQYMPESWVQKRIDALRCLAETYIVQGRYPLAIETFEQILSISWQMSLRVLAAEIFTRMGWTFFLLRDFQRALEVLKNGHALHKENDYARGVAMSLSHMGKVYTVIGDYQTARLYLQEALDLRREMKNPGDIAWTLSDMGNLLLQTGRLDEAMAHHQEALEIRKELGQTAQTVQSMNNLAAINVLKGNYDAALAELLLSANLVKKMGERLMMAVILVNIGELYLLRGELKQASDNLERALHIAEKIEDKLIMAECYRLLGELELKRSEALLALDHCRDAYALIQEGGIRSALAGIFRLMGDVYAALPQEVIEQNEDDEIAEGLPEKYFGNALACFEESIEIASKHENLQEEAKSRMRLGFYEVNRGNVERGRYHLELAKADFRRLNMQKFEEESARFLNEVKQFQEEEKAPAPDISLFSTGAGLSGPDRTLQFNVQFDEDEVGPAPTPAVISEEEKKVLLQDNEPPQRFRQPRVVSKPFFLPELEEFRRQKAAERATSEGDTKAQKPSAPLVFDAEDVETSDELPAAQVAVQESLSQEEIEALSAEDALDDDDLLEIEEENEDAKTVIGAVPQVSPSKKIVLPPPVFPQPPAKSSEEKKEEEKAPTALLPDIEELEEEDSDKAVTSLERLAMSLPPLELPSLGLDVEDKAAPVEETHAVSDVSPAETPDVHEQVDVVVEESNSETENQSETQEASSSAPDELIVPEAQEAEVAEVSSEEEVEDIDDVAEAEGDLKATVQEFPKDIKSLVMNTSPKEVEEDATKDEVEELSEDFEPTSKHETFSLDRREADQVEAQETLKVTLPESLMNVSLEDLGAEQSEEHAPYVEEEDPLSDSLIGEEETISMVVIDHSEYGKPKKKKKGVTRIPMPPSPGKKQHVIPVAPPMSPSSEHLPAISSELLATTELKVPDIKDDVDVDVDVDGQEDLSLEMFEDALSEDEAGPDTMRYAPVMIGDTTKKPSVYDSMVIIAQVAEDDDISRDWFEEGRSDRTKTFWKERREEREQVKEELMHEQVIEEIDKIELQDDEPEDKKSSD